MPENRSELRTKLENLTQPPEGAGLEWLDYQIAQIEALKGEPAHMISVHTRWNRDLTSVNCYMFALDLTHAELKDFRDVGIQPDVRTGFIPLLLKSPLLIKCATPGDAPEGSLVVYYDDSGRPMHAGRWTGGMVTSKWGDGCTHIWRHGLWEVPLGYGGTVEFFLPPSKDDVLKAYITWAKSRWCGD